MRVFYVVTAAVSARSFLLSHFRTLKDSGHDVYLICNPDNISKELAELETIEVIEVPISPSISPFKDIVSAGRLVWVVLRLRPDVIHSHMSKAGLIGAIAGFLSRVKVRIYHNHGMALFSSSGVKRILLQFVERITCALSSEVIFCSLSTREMAHEFGVCSKNKSIVLGQGTISGVDIDKYHLSMSEEDRINYKNNLGISNQVLMVGFVGRVVPHKGIEDLIEAWIRLPSLIHERVGLLVAGEVSGSPLESKFLSFVDKFENVYYLGRRSDIEKIYQVLDLIVLPSFHEGFPYSILEAQSVGVPAIVTMVPGNTDSVKDSVTGLHIPVNNPTSLAESIEYLIENESKRKEMSRAARDRVKLHFQDRIVQQKLVMFYKQIADRL